MSYSIRAKAATAALALTSIRAQFDNVVASQAAHAKDKAVVLGAVTAAAAFVGDADDKDVEIVVSGSLSGSWRGNELASVSGVHLNVSVNQQARETAAAP